MIVNVIVSYNQYQSNIEKFYKKKTLNVQNRQNKYIYSEKNRILLARSQHIKKNLYQQSKSRLRISSQISLSEASSRQKREGS